MRRTNADKRRAVLCLLEDDEWVQRSDRWIAEQCGVHGVFVGDVRRELTADGQQSTTRTGQDGRTINTTNIGKPLPSDNVAPILAQTTQRAYPTPEPLVQSKCDEQAWRCEPKIICFTY